MYLIGICIIVSSYNLTIIYLLDIDSDEEWGQFVVIDEEKI